MIEFKKSYKFLSNQAGVGTKFHVDWSEFGELNMLSPQQIKESKEAIDKIVETNKGHFEMGLERAFLFAEPKSSKAIYMRGYEREVSTSDIKDFVDKWVRNIEDWELENTHNS